MDSPIATDSLAGTDWDIIIDGTDLPQSLLALSLSRSKKKILHVDRNGYYGGREAALSLEEAESWAAGQASGLTDVYRASDSSRLSFSRAYSLSLSPHIIYTTSNLLSALVSSRVHTQLEFLPVGDFFLYKKVETTADQGSDSKTFQCHAQHRLTRIPSSREDIFTNPDIDNRSSRNLTRFLRLAVDDALHDETLLKSGSLPFSQFLSDKFKLSKEVQASLHTLTLSPHSPDHTSTRFALPRIRRHLISTGRFGPGFCAVIPKWGGAAEVAQLACRTSAVGGSVYLLGQGIQETAISQKVSNSDPSTQDRVCISLTNGEKMTAKHVVSHAPNVHASSDHDITHRAVAIVASGLPELFVRRSEISPAPACAVVTFEAGSISLPETQNGLNEAPIYLLVHSSDSGECPPGQCIVYAQMTHFGQRNDATVYLAIAIERLLLSLQEPVESVLWRTIYSRPGVQCCDEMGTNRTSVDPKNDKMLYLQSLSNSIVLEDSVLDDVCDIWKIISSDPADLSTSDAPFMHFPERSHAAEDGEAGEPASSDDPQ